MSEEIKYGFDNNPVGVWTATVKTAVIMPELPTQHEYYVYSIDNTQIDDYMRLVVHQMD